MLYTRNDRGVGMSRLTIAGRWSADHSVAFQLRVGAECGPRITAVKGLSRMISLIWYRVDG
jgi:hypothetical protein